MKESRIEVLARIAPFGELPAEALGELAAAIAPTRFSAGARLAVQGRSTLDYVYIVRAGRLELFFEVPGKTTLHAALEPGDVFGAISILFNGGLAIRSLRALEEAEIWLIPRKKFLDLCRRHARMASHFERLFAERMQNEEYAQTVAGSLLTQFLARVPPFSFLPEEELRRLAPRLRRVFIPRDTRLFVQGESRVDGLYVLQSGAAERFYEEHGKRRLVNVMGEGEIFGGISMLVNDMLAVRSLRTLEDCYFCKLECDAFYDLCRRYPIFSEFFTDAFGKRMLDRTYAAIIAKSASGDAGAVAFFDQPLAAVSTRDLLACEASLPIREAARRMSARRCSSILVRDERGQTVGIVTDSDMRSRAVATGRSLEEPVAAIMTSPLRSLPDRASVFEGLMAMMQHGIKHLAVTDPSGEVAGVVTQQDILGRQGVTPWRLLRDVAGETRPEVFKALGLRLPRLLQGLIRSGTTADQINRFLTAFTDAVLERLCQAALAELGTPPGAFAFLLLGSEGRREQTLCTDQDNALLYEDPPPGGEAAAQAWYLRFGERVCAELDRAGFRRCRAEVMASNPRLCQPFSVWQRRFREWIHAAEAEDLLYASIFFDFRLGFGDGGLVERLRGSLAAEVAGWPGFLRHLVQNALHTRPPIGIFRNLILESKGEHRRKLDIKRAMQPIVDAARIYALKYGMAETNTLARLRQWTAIAGAADREILDIEQGYRFLMQLRLAHQAEQMMQPGLAADNHIDPQGLSGMEQRMLKEVFLRIAALQTRLSLEWTGEP
ncbi:MAG: DUF294 nucleotidyltransferase-like domain-containing protein [Desulfobacterales bacterium]